MLIRISFTITLLFFISQLKAQENYDNIKVENVKPVIDQEIAGLIKAVSADSIKNYIAALVRFETRHSLSDTTSNTRGIGTARRWVAYKFNQFAQRNKANMTVVLDPYHLEPKSTSTTHQQAGYHEKCSRDFTGQ